MGSRREARQAGYNPLRTPTAVAKPTLMRMAEGSMTGGLSSGATRPSRSSRTTPAPRPRNPPMIPMTVL